MLPLDCNSRCAARRCQQRHYVFLTFPIFLSDFKHIWTFWADFQKGPNLSSGSRVGTSGICLKSVTLYLSPAPPPPPPPSPPPPPPPPPFHKKNNTKKKKRKKKKNKKKKKKIKKSKNKK